MFRKPEIKEQERSFDQKRSVFLGSVFQQKLWKVDPLEEPTAGSLEPTMTRRELTALMRMMIADGATDDEIVSVCRGLIGAGIVPKSEMTLARQEFDQGEIPGFSRSLS